MPSSPAGGGGQEAPVTTAAPAFDLERFVRAQDGPSGRVGTTSYEQAMLELRRGQKRTHWMWWIFPQAVGLSSSARGHKFSVKSIAEAQSYLAHPILGQRLRDATQAVLDTGKNDRGLSIMFGPLDHPKLKSCWTLFGMIEGGVDEDALFYRAVDGIWPGGDHWQQAADSCLAFPDFATWAAPHRAAAFTKALSPAGSTPSGNEPTDGGADDDETHKASTRTRTPNYEGDEGDDIAVTQNRDKSEITRDSVGHDMFDPDNKQPEGEVWDVAGIRASRTWLGGLEYQVDWRGADEVDHEWYPAANLKGAAPCLQAFHEANPKQAGPPMNLDTWLEAFQRGVVAAPHSDDNRSVTAIGPQQLQRRRAALARWRAALEQSKRRTGEQQQQQLDPGVEGRKKQRRRGPSTRSDHPR